jgi:hypothetical protein
MPTVDQERNKKAALELYGPWVGRPMHDTPKAGVPSFIAHELLVRVFRFTDADAGSMVNTLIHEARMKPEASDVFGTHGGKREWEVTAVAANPATLFWIKELTE